MTDQKQQATPDNENPTSGMDATDRSAEQMDSDGKRTLRFSVIGIAIAVLLVTGILLYLHSRGYEETDDAQVDAHLAPIASRVDGTVRAVYVEDNTYVKAGQPLADLDAADSQVALQRAQAKYDQAVGQQQAQNPNVPATQVNNATNMDTQTFEVQNARAALASAEHDADNAAAMLSQSEANNARAQADYQRYKVLYEKREVSRADYDNYAAIAAAQAAAVEGYRSLLASARNTIDQRKALVAEQKSKLSQYQRNAPRLLAIQQSNNLSQAANAEALRADLSQAKLNLQYVHIAAPVSGYTTQRSVEVGSRISAGQQLLMIAQTDDLWVTANFKETQLAHMRVGQSVSIHVDALKRTFSGTVESMPTITGSRSSVLPPQNATGNYVKVVQRLPMRIRFNKGQQGLEQLCPGMSVEPTVHLN
jgi:membrane fusion protein (multidrug efflux system)